MNELVIIIIIVILIIIMLFGIWCRKSLYSCDDFGIWTNGYITNCSELDVYYDIKFCKPNPITGKGCLDNDNVQKFVKVVEHPCKNSLVKSSWETTSIGDCLLYIDDGKGNLIQKSSLSCKESNDVPVREIKKTCKLINKNGDLNQCVDDEGKQYQIGDTLIHKVQCNDYKNCGMWSECTNPFNFDQSSFTKAMVETCPAVDCFGTSFQTSTPKCTKIKYIKGEETLIEVPDDQCSSNKPLCQSSCIRFPCKSCDYSGCDLFISQYFNQALFIQQNELYLKIDLSLYSNLSNIPEMLPTNFISYQSVDRKEERDTYGLLCGVIPVSPTSNQFRLVGFLNNGVFGFLDLISSKTTIGTELVWYQGDFHQTGVKIQDAPQFTATFISENTYCIVNNKTKLQINLTFYNDYSVLHNMESTLHHPQHPLVIEYKGLMTKRNQVLNNNTSL
jgi:hypothetical protein